MTKGKREFLTGFAIGAAIGLLAFGKIAFGAEISPEDAELTVKTVQLEAGNQSFEGRRLVAEEKVEIPEEIEFWCEYYGGKYDICPETLEAMCWVESRCIPSAQSQDKSCKGLMQVKPSCHVDRMNRLGVRNIFGVWENIKTGTDYLAELMEDEDLATALTIYNGQSQKKIEAARRGEYSKYVSNILKISEALERSHNK